MKNNVNGILLLNKPLHLTSNDALQRVKYLFSAKKAGHTGNLDPLATGMLPICFGEATKFSQFLLGSDKYYRVTLRLGMKTTTGDGEGDIIETNSTENISQEKINKILPKFIGEIFQIPPMFSALKHRGVPLYQLARQGIEVERKSRAIIIYSLQQENYSEDHLSLLVHCSKGTYIRTLAEDIGEALGCGAYVTQLHRVAVTPYAEKEMHELSSLEKIQNSTELMKIILPIETSAQHFPSLKLSASSAFYLKAGQAIRIPHALKEGWVRLFLQENFLGIGEILSDGRLAPRRLVTQA